MYDPLIDKSIPSSHIKPDGFWAKDLEALQCPSLQSNIETEVVIVGGGYTGLSAAYHLKTNYNIDSVVLEANQPGWGCSGRNGGFVLPGTGRLTIDETIKRWGKQTSVEMFAEYQQSINTVEKFITKGINCERIAGGYLKLAHKKQLLAPLHKQAQMMAENYGDSVLALSSSDIKNNYLQGAENVGGVYYPKAFSINPWLFAQGIAKLCLQKGVNVYGNSPVTDTHYNSHKHVLTTPSGTVTAKTLIIATNAYTSRKLFPIIQDRYFPVMSSIIVTDVLTKSQLNEIGMKEGLMVMDTRPLKYYYRLLPNNRLLFGGRGAIKGKNSNNQKYKRLLIEGLSSTFPALSNINISDFHSGWVAISFDDYPRIHFDKQLNTLYSAGYCGAGLAFSVQAGQRLAQLYKEPDSLPPLPFWQSPLQKFPLPSVRRTALKTFYAWESLKRACKV